MRGDFQRLAELRAREAEALARNGHEQGAYYLAGYAIECALKACIAKKTKRHEFPAKPRDVQAIYTHNLAELLKLAELDADLDRDMRTNPSLAAKWVAIAEWNENSRYQTARLRGADLCAAVSDADGVLAWIRQRW